MSDIYWRSLLFVPANNPRFVKKADSTRADAVILDLEDAILPEHKTEARSAVHEAARSLGSGSRDVLVRINHALTLAVPDIEAIICREVKALVVAKTASAEHLRLLSEVVDEREAALGLPLGHTKFLPLIETADAVAQLHEIAAGPRVVAIACGDEDLAAELGCDPASEAIVTLKYQLILAAARASVRPLGLFGSIAEFKDTEKYRSFVERSNSAGLRGTLCIHPNQIDVANRGFAPSQEQLDHARRIIEAAEAARKSGRGAVALDGKMIDPPVLRRAEEIVSGRRSDQ